MAIYIKYNIIILLIGILSLNLFYDKASAADALMDKLNCNALCRALFVAHLAKEDKYREQLSTFVEDNSVYIEGFRATIESDAYQNKTFTDDAIASALFSGSYEIAPGLKIKYPSQTPIALNPLGHTLIKNAAKTMKFGPGVSALARTSARLIVGGAGAALIGIGYAGELMIEKHALDRARRAMWQEKGPFADPIFWENVTSNPNQAARMLLEYRDFLLIKYADPHLSDGIFLSYKAMVDDLATRINALKESGLSEPEAKKEAIKQSAEEDESCATCAPFDEREASLTENASQVEAFMNLTSLWNGQFILSIDNEVVMPEREQNGLTWEKWEKIKEVAEENLKGMEVIASKFDPTVAKTIRQVRLLMGLTTLPKLAMAPYGIGILPALGSGISIFDQAFGRQGASETELVIKQLQEIHKTLSQQIEELRKDVLIALNELDRRSQQRYEKLYGLLAEVNDNVLYNRKLLSHLVSGDFKYCERLIPESLEFSRKDGRLSIDLALVRRGLQFKTYAELASVWTRQNRFVRRCMEMIEDHFIFGRDEINPAFQLRPKAAGESESKSWAQVDAMTSALRQSAALFNPALIQGNSWPLYDFSDVETGYLAARKSIERGNDSGSGSSRWVQLVSTNFEKPLRTDFLSEVTIFLLAAHYVWDMIDEKGRLIDPVKRPDSLLDVGGSVGQSLIASADLMNRLALMQLNVLSGGSLIEPLRQLFSLDPETILRSEVCPAAEKAQAPFSPIRLTKALKDVCMPTDEAKFREMVRRVVKQAEVLFLQLDTGNPAFARNFLRYAVWRRLTVEAADPTRDWNEFLKLRPRVAGHESVFTAGKLTSLLDAKMLKVRSTSDPSLTSEEKEEIYRKKINPDDLFVSSFGVVTPLPNVEELENRELYMFEEYRALGLLSVEIERALGLYEDFVPKDLWLGHPALVVEQALFEQSTQ